MLLLFSLLALKVQAQEQMIVLPTQELSVEQVIDEIRKQSGWIVGVNHRTFDITRKIRPQAQRLSVHQLLDRIVEGTGHGYLSRGNHVMIVKEEKPVVVQTDGHMEIVGGELPFATADSTVLKEGEYILVEPEIREYTTVRHEPAADLLFAVRSPRENNKIRVTGISIRQEQEQVRIGFAVIAEQEVINTNQAITVRPVLQSGGSRQEFAPVFQEGNKYRLSRQRQARSRGTEPVVEAGRIPLHGGDTVRYEELLPLSSFEPGATLNFESSVADCHRYTQETVQTGAHDFVRHHREVILPELPPPPTTGDRIAQDYPFVEQDPGELRIRPDRQKALIVYYELDKYILKYDYRQNNVILGQIIAAINIIRESGDSEITHVVLSGYASPEGPLARNEVLAGNRGKALRDFIVEHTGLPERAFILHNGASDWEGLQMWVENSEAPWKEAVLDILKQAPEKDRMRRIKALEGGGVYEYMLETVLPDLRNAAYLRVYYRNK